MLVYLLKQAKLKQQLQEAFSENLLESQEKERTRIAQRTCMIVLDNN